ncbi:MAG: ABC transporter permease subunit [Burkholderiaceae bacterium]
MIRIARIVFRKELVDGLRDRRTLMTIFITALLMGPVSLLLLANFISGYEQKGELRQIYVDGIEHAPEFANFLERNAIRVLRPPPGYERDIRTGQLQEAVLVLPDDFSAKIAHGQTVAVKIILDESRSDAQPSARRAESILHAFNREVALLRAIDRGVNPELFRPVDIEHVNTATPKQQGAFLLFLIPLFALIGAVVGSMSAAIDTTAGERERGSLEPLLMNPVDLRALVLGKWTAVAAHSCTVVVLTLASFAIATEFVPSERLATLFQFGVPEFLQFCALMLPFACMVSALQMLVATYGRTFKEAQTYASYIALVINFVPLVTIFSALRESTWQLFVPALAQQVVLARVLRGDPVGALDYTLPLVMAALITIACLWSLTRLLRRESIIFGR